MIFYLPRPVSPYYVFIICGYVRCANRYWDHFFDCSFSTVRIALTTDTAKNGRVIQKPGYVSAIGKIPALYKIRRGAMVLLVVCY